jgi:hypothetical protein
MKIWTFKKFIERGVSDVDGWRKGLPPKARARMDVIISHLEITLDWRDIKYVTPLSGYEGILEIKFIVQNRQYRPLGCYGPKRSFIMLIGAEEKGGKFEPLSAPETAVKRRKLVLKDERHIDDYYST